MLVGGHPALGEWEPGKGARLNPPRTEGGAGHRVELLLPSDTAIAAKVRSCTCLSGLAWRQPASLCGCTDAQSRAEDWAQLALLSSQPKAPLSLLRECPFPGPAAGAHAGWHRDSLGARQRPHAALRAAAAAREPGCGRAPLSPPRHQPTPQTPTPTTASHAHPANCFLHTSPAPPPPRPASPSPRPCLLPPAQAALGPDTWPSWSGRTPTPTPSCCGRPRWGRGNRVGHGAGPAGQKQASQRVRRM